MRLKAAYPDARIVVGNTEVGIESRYKNHPAKTFLSAMAVPELRSCWYPATIAAARPDPLEEKEVRKVNLDLGGGYY